MMAKIRLPNAFYAAGVAPPRGRQYRFARRIMQLEYGHDQAATAAAYPDRAVL
jgi:hypothetical protein